MRTDARQLRSRRQPDANQLSLFDESREEASPRPALVATIETPALFESTGENPTQTVPQPLQRVHRWLQQRAEQRENESRAAGDSANDDPLAVSRDAEHADDGGHTGAARAQLAACVLGSGSGGNSTVIRCGAQAMLIDAGFGPRTTEERLAQVGVPLADVRAICLTHLDQDHFRPSWIRTIVALGIRVYLHRWHVSYLNQYGDAEDLRRADLLRVFDGQSFEPMDGLRVSTVPLPHDDKGTSAFHVEAVAGRASNSSDSSAPRIGYATDLGHVPDALIDLFAGVDLLMLESNYDPHLQLTSSRPAFLKARIMGDHGHLSNEQALDACRRIAAKSPRGNPQKIVLLHRSQQCNTHELVRQTFASEPMFAKCFTVAQQRRHTPWFAVRPLCATARQQIGMSF